MDKLRTIFPTRLTDQGQLTSLRQTLQRIELTAGMEKEIVLHTVLHPGRVGSVVLIKDLQKLLRKLTAQHQAKAALATLIKLTALHGIVHKPAQGDLKWYNAIMNTIRMSTKRGLGEQILERFTALAALKEKAPSAPLPHTPPARRSLLDKLNTSIPQLF